MAILNPYLVKQFVDQSDNQTNTSKQKLKGTVKVQNNGVFVQLDGSEVLTPVILTAAALDGDRVYVEIENHEARVVGNLTSPAARSADVAELGNDIRAMNNAISAQNNVIAAFGNTITEINNNVTEIGNTVNSQGNTITEINNKVISQDNVITEIGNTVNSQGNTITEINNNVTEIGNNVTSQGNTITEINNNVTEIGNTVISQGNKITEIDSTIATQGSSITTLQSSVSTLGSTVQTQGSNITTLQSNVSTIDSTVKSQGSSITALQSNVSTLDSTVQTHGSNISTLQSNINTANSNISILNSGFVIENGAVKGLSSMVLDDMSLTYLKSDFTNINHADINQANVQELFVGSGFIQKETVGESTIFNLTGVHVTGDVIDVNTIAVNKLILRSDDKNSGLIYTINELTGAVEHSEATKEELEQQLDGKVIVAHSITSEELTTENIQGSHGWINFAQGTFNYGGKISFDGNELYIDSDVVIGDLKADLENGTHTVLTKVNGGSITTGIIQSTAKKLDGSPLFYLNMDTGKVSMYDGEFVGDISADSGRIGDFLIGSGEIESVPSNPGFSSLSNFVPYDAHDNRDTTLSRTDYYKSSDSAVGYSHGITSDYNSIISYTIRAKKTTEAAATLSFGRCYSNGSLYADASKTVELTDEYVDYTVSFEITKGTTFQLCFNTTFSGVAIKTPNRNAYSVFTYKSSRFILNKSISYNAYNNIDGTQLFKINDDDNLIYIGRDKIDFRYGDASMLFDQNGAVLNNVNINSASSFSVVQYIEGLEAAEDIWNGLRLYEEQQDIDDDEYYKIHGIKNTIMNHDSLGFADVCGVKSYAKDYYKTSGISLGGPGSPRSRTYETDIFALDRVNIVSDFVDIKTTSDIGIISSSGNIELSNANNAIILQDQGIEISGPTMFSSDAVFNTTYTGNWKAQYTNEFNMSLGGSQRVWFNYRPGVNDFDKDTAINEYMFGNKKNGVTGVYLHAYGLKLNDKVALSGGDSWLRINDGTPFNSGVYFGTSVVRTDGKILCGYADSTANNEIVAYGTVQSYRKSGEAQVMASNGTNRLYMYANTDGRRGIYGVNASGTAHAILSIAAGGTTASFNGTATGNLALSGGVMTGDIKFPSEHGIWDNTNGHWLLRLYSGWPCFGNTSQTSHIYSGSNVYKNGSTSTYFSTTSGSDRRLKNEVSHLDKYEDFYMKLNPIAFKYHDGLYNPDNRKPFIQWGFYAQDTIKAFDESGIDWCDEELVVVEDGELTAEEQKYIDKDLLRMNYQNMIALNTHMIQNAYKQIKELTEELNKLKEVLQYERSK